MEVVMRVAVLGASAKEERYSHQAVLRLKEAGHEVYPVNPALSELAGLKVWPDLSALRQNIDTVTVYLSAANSSGLADALCQLHPRRVIFNPGAENSLLADKLRAAGIEVQLACTLVLLKTNQF